MLLRLGPAFFAVAASALVVTLSARPSLAAAAAAAAAAGNLNVATATFLGDAEAQLVPSSVDVLPNGDVVVAGNGRPTIFPATHVSFAPRPQHSTSARDTAGNATLLLIPAGRLSAASAFYFAGIAAARSTCNNNNNSAPAATATGTGTGAGGACALVLLGDFGMAAVSASDPTKVLWHDPLRDVGFGPCPSAALPRGDAMDRCSLAVGPQGRLAAAFLGGPGEFHWLSLLVSVDSGRRVLNATYGKNHFGGIAVDDHSGVWLRGGFFEDHLPSHKPVQVASAFALGTAAGSGPKDASYVLYDYPGKALVRGIGA